nr:glycoside hydrolase family 104 protein [uncultured Comamonas sp.]
MRSSVAIAAAAVLAAGAWVMYRRQQDAAVDWSMPDGFGELWGDTAGIVGDLGQGAASLVDSVTGGSLKISNMSRVTAADVAHPNVQAMLRVIRRGEGTADEAGYRRLFGGQQFSGYADHPRTKVSKSGYTSTAAGAYQFLSSTWDETARVMGLTDFSPRNQDWGAVGRMAYRGALDDVKAGRFEAAIRKIAREWASMPGSPYGQPVISMETARTVYVNAGGNAYA